MRTLVPNPFDKESTLTSLAQKAEIIKELVGLRFFFRNLVFLILTSVIFIAYFKISTPLIGIIFGVEILIQFVFFFIKSSKIKTLYKLDSSNFKQFVVKKEYYNLIHSVVGFFSDLFIAVILLTSLTDLLNSQQFFNIPIQTIVFMFVVFRFFELIINWIRYKSFLKIEEKETFAEINQQVVVIEQKLGITKFVPQMSVLLFIFWYISIPPYIIAIFGGILILMIIISIFTIRRISHVQLSQEAISQPTEQILEANQNERVLGAVYGIMNLQTSGSSFLGVGKMKKTENTLLITKDRLLFVQIPATGGSNIVGDISYSETNFFWNRNEIRKKGEKLVNSGLQQLLNSVPLSYEIPYIKIQEMVLDKMKVKITTTEGKKYSYVFMDREYIDLIKNLLQNWSKFSVK